MDSAPVMAVEPSLGDGRNLLPPDLGTQEKRWPKRSDTSRGTVDGTTAGRRLPEWKDPINGDISVLAMKPAKENGILPNNPFIIRKSIENAVGAIEDARPEAKGNRYILKVRQTSQIEKLMKLQQLIDGTAIVIDFHEFLNVRKCIVSCQYGMELNDEELLNELKSQRVVQVKRFMRKNPKDNKKSIPTATMVVTLQGTTIPEYLYFGFVRVKTRIYYPSPLQCIKCHRLGHTERYCVSSITCLNCSKEHTETEPCSAGLQCINCSGSHSSRSRECPSKKEEISIIKIKVDEDISYAEARRRHEARRKNSQPGKNANEGVSGLLKEIEVRDQEIAEVRKLLETLITQVAELKKEKLQTRMNDMEIDSPESKNVKRRQESEDYSPTRPTKEIRCLSPPNESSDATSSEACSMTSGTIKNNEYTLNRSTPKTTEIDIHQVTLAPAHPQKRRTKNHH